MRSNLHEKEMDKQRVVSQLQEKLKVITTFYWFLSIILQFISVTFDDKLQNFLFDTIISTFELNKTFGSFF